MQKIYLLLRNNKQTGPYSLEEIIASGLKSFDLIWVEGRSAGWRYPSEIDSLKPYLPDQPGIPEIKSPESVINQAASFPIATPIEATLKSTGKHIFVCLPSGIKQRIVEKPVENIIQEIHQTVSTPNFVESVNSQSTLLTEPIPETRYNRSLDEVEQDYTNWVFKSKRKKSSLQLNKQTVVFGTVGVLVCAALYFGVSKMVANNTSDQLAKAIEQKPIASGTVSINSSTEHLENKPDPKQATTTPVITNAVQQNIVSAPVKNNLPIETGIHKSYSNHAGKKSVQTPLLVKRSLPQQANQNSTTVIAKQPEQIKHEQTTAQILKNTQASPKKKGLSAFFNGVFGKLKKKNNNQEPVSEKEPTPISPMPSETRSNGERRATRRSDEANTQADTRETETIDEKDFSPQSNLIDLEGSERNNSWQLGIYDLKLTLLNRNNVPLKSAGVDVLYFDENNRLLEKKTIYFTNIASRGRATIKVPDQKWADHTDYKLISLK